MNVRGIDLLTGQAAHDILTAPHFLASWNALHAKCRHATGFQAPAFVCTWYDAYHDKWEPVIVRSFATDGELVGLWLLAHSRDEQMLVHAGAHQAEYQVWLTRPGADAAFLAAAWKEIQRNFPFRVLRFKYLPTVRLADELSHVPGLGNCLSVQVHRRPLVLLNSTEIKASLAKKSNKSRFNRLKKLGVLDFRRLTDPVELEQVYDDIIAFYDLRQGAINHVSPFRDDPLKRGFYRALFAATDESEVTVTYLDGRAIAAFWGVASGETVHLGMLAHTPFLAEHSPGKLHLLHLSDHLLQRGKKVLDLTPGGDPWKERFANCHDEVADATIYPTASARKRAEHTERLLRWTKSCAARVGVQSTDLRKAFRKLRRVRPSGLRRRFLDWVGEQREFRLYRGNRIVAEGLTRDVRVMRNSLLDLLYFEPGEAWQNREEFLARSLARLESGESVYTVRIGKRLAHYGWMVRNQTTSYMTEVHQSVNLPSGSVVLYDFYTHPDFRGQGLYRAAIRTMLCEAFTDCTTQHCYISVLANNASSRHVIDDMHFQYQGSFYWKHRFGSQTKWADPVFTQW
jgi:CelD/BcsL family acetyltransferase involved in cellulose biosynthesis/RimJ/RimL family protein N-acetyltransferase